MVKHLFNTRVRIFSFCRAKPKFFFPELNIRLYDKNSESDYFFFPPPKSEYFFQQHWESEYFFRKRNNPLLTNKLFYTSRWSHYLSKNQLMTWMSKRMLCIWLISHNYFSIYFQMFLNLSEYDYNVQCFKTLWTPVICHITRWTHYSDTKSSIVCFHVYCSKYQYHCLPFNTTGIDLIISRNRYDNHYKSTDYLLQVYIELLY